MSDFLLSVRDLKKYFPGPRQGIFGKHATLKAVDGVSFDLARGEVLSLVGESGSGKSTVGRTVLRLDKPTGGSIRFDGQELAGLDDRGLRPFRRRMQLVFQDPYSSLNPKMRVEDIVGAPLEIHEPSLSRDARRQKVEEILGLVGLLPSHAERYPHQFSGGQRQRLGIARALITHPELVVADEPVSALDVSVQAQVVTLMLALRRQLGLTILFISHDLAVVGYLSDRVAVMYLGRLVELAPTRALFTSPRHPYTEALLSAMPVPDPDAPRRRITLAGDMPSPLDPPSGCAFRSRCGYAQPACAVTRPELREMAPGHFKACLRDDLALVAPSMGAAA
ncbi:ABC transporter ATP-binding protein [Roseomonas sp. 18066]|uniref:ABC transporter ATP-binding protein n=1 Tax=Roseomonas sp. 18066 TaxID=2681412 RepID=UPI00135A420B|nr:oligopeptide/dipeptide ABC transporter ATP-binding protein [Roseomonas sp. 18066]